MAAPKSNRLVPGILLIVFGATCNAVGIGLTVVAQARRRHRRGDVLDGVQPARAGRAGCAAGDLGRRQRDAPRSMDKIVALATASQRLPIDVIASDLGVTAKIARELLLAAIGERRIIGSPRSRAGRVRLGLDPRRRATGRDDLPQLRRAPQRDRLRPRRPRCARTAAFASRERGALDHTPAAANAALTIACASSWIRRRWSAPRKLSA